MKIKNKNLNLSKQDNDYSNSYARSSIHEDMIKDHIRTDAYHEAISKNRHLFKDKIVLDVGCGTGILSLFAAKAGAKKVYAIDMSNIAESAMDIVRVNQMDKVITVIKTKAEDLAQLPDGIEKVDIIISEWMGYSLFYESMLTSVLYCRDKWLANGGLIFPDEIILNLAGIQDYQYKEGKVNWWKNVYGFNMSSMIRSVIAEPIVDYVEIGNVCTDIKEIFRVNMYSIKPEDVNFEQKFSLKFKRSDYMHAFIIYFDVHFNECHVPIKFSTGPYTPPTHWKQTIMYMKDYITALEDEIVHGTITFKQNDANPRFLDLIVDFKFEGQFNSLVEKNSYFMG
ncbi:hypothetical protein A3Q56_02566 [Intoshia linei]|uniref:type I protein arginine methyltransferase n=1 Tax=Intoshia linei TaxID=1819745 RepID=A0A177B816_9BILA|nr:hypothetical protein A3Q56_02566 [Intoshia linei]